MQLKTEDTTLLAPPTLSVQDREFVRRFCGPISEKGLNHYVSNIATHLEMHEQADALLPVTINDSEYENAFVCSPFGYYVSYAMLYLDLIKNRWGRKSCSIIMDGFSRLMPAASLNKVVAVNNWPFATVLWPTLSQDDVHAIKKHYLSQYPHHTLMFRSFNEKMNADLLKNLKKEGFHIISSRAIFLLNGKDPEVFKTRIFKSDLKLMRETEYEILDGSALKDEDYKRLIDLYTMVYLEKYSDLNPAHTEELLKHGVASKTMELRVLVKNGSIDGVVAFYERSGVMTCPFFGYDTTKPLGDKLYRCLCTVLMLEAQKRQVLFHQSSGAAFYKTIRRAECCIDYTAVYIKHLPWYRKLPWYLIGGIMNGIGVKFMKEA